MDVNNGRQVTLFAEFIKVTPWTILGNGASGEYTLLLFPLVRAGAV